MRVRFLTRKNLNIIFIIVIVFYLIISGYSVYNFTRMSESVNWVQHTDSVIYNLEYTLSILKDAETGSRGYLLTSKKEFLAPYYIAVSKLDDNISYILKLTEDNPLQQKNAEELRRLANSRIDKINESISLYDNKKFDSATAIKILTIGKNTMDRIRELVDKMKTEESSLWQQRDSNFNEFQKTFITAFIIGLSISLFVLVLVFLSLNKQIMERDKAEKAISESRNLLSVTLSSIGDAVISTDEKGLIRFMNRVAENLTEWNFHEAAGRYVEDVFHIVNESTHQRPENPVKKVLTNGQVIGLANHTLLITKSGKELSIDDSCAPIMNENEIIGTVLIFRDITSKRNLEVEKNRLADEINKQKLFLDQILTSTSDVLIVQDRQFKISYANRNSFMDVDKNEIGLLGNKWPEKFLSSANSDNIIEIINNTFTTGNTNIYNYSNADINNMEYFECVSNPVYDKNKIIEYVASSIRDVTDRKLNELKIIKLNSELEGRLSEIKIVNEEMESFIYTVSHDLRAPIRHISGFMDILRKNIFDTLEEKNQRYINIISQATVEMGKLIDDLLTFSRLGRSSLNVVNVNMNELIKIVIEEFKIDTNGRNLQWKINELPQVQADPSLLKVVLSNLIGNSIKYTSGREEAVIEIGHKIKEDGLAIFFIKDNGVGFDMKYYDKLFGVFQRLHTQDEFEGTGIGLATVKKIIQKHGGSVWAEGKLNEGAVFYFIIPIFS